MKATVLLLALIILALSKTVSFEESPHHDFLNFYRPSYITPGFGYGWKHNAASEDKAHDYLIYPTTSYTSWGGMGWKHNAENDKA